MSDENETAVAEAEQEPAPEPVAAEKPIEYEHTINGHRIVFRRSYPLKTSYLLPKMVSDATADDWRKRVPFLCAIIESWSYAGDPTKPGAYDALDMFDDIEPLTSVGIDIIQARMRASRRLKN
ncbi:MAG: hypothetical protein ACYC4L_04630 [Chloroflexota bacterium]